MSERPTITLESIERALLDGAHPFAGEPDRERADLGLVPVFSDERPLQGLAGLMDWRGSGCLSAIVRSGFCTSRLGEQVLLPCDRRLPVERLVLVGLGPREQFGEVEARALGPQLVKISSGLSAESVLIALPDHAIERALVEVIVEGLLAALEPNEVAPNEVAPNEVAFDGPAEGDALTSQDVPRSGGVGHVNQQWWIAADEAVVARLRRVLAGPPRPARSGQGLHT